jgi:crossover junction endodeoxyribonuclease RuvC
MRILGIDPALRVTGFGVIEVQGQRLHYIASGTIETGGTEILSMLAFAK